MEMVEDMVAATGPDWVNNDGLVYSVVTYP